eukprot:TRINITY_DN2946_c0_g1_i2.p1 TRINITY_DN2946_c0_g1~~TRINITY_DN2946_c0_g1_i2.p1  ORF type:complete len:309 (+),score=45.88 TRINITY_DN2946_c0_g1_i2:54-929(+)
MASRPLLSLASGRLLPSLFCRQRVQFSSTIDPFEVLLPGQHKPVEEKREKFSRPKKAKPDLIIPDPPEASQFKTPWRIVGSAILQRWPVVTKPLEKWEEDWLDLKVRRVVASQKDETFLKDIQLSEEEKYIAEQRELARYQNDQVPLPRVTKDDLSNNRKSLHRKLWNSLYLIVKKPREQHAWQFPQGGVEKKETIRQTAERELREECGELEYYGIANHPIGHFQYALPPEYQKKHDCYGTKVFFMRCLYMSGEVKIDGKEIVDYAWVTKEEMKEYFDTDLYNRVKLMIHD